MCLEYQLKFPEAVFLFCFCQWLSFRYELLRAEYVDCNCCNANGRSSSLGIVEIVLHLTRMRSQLSLVTVTRIDCHQLQIHDLAPAAFYAG